MLWPFELFTPKHKQEVTDLLREQEGAKILAGGTDLLCDMRGGIHRPQHVIDINKIDELGDMSFSAAGGFIGACVDLNRIIEDRNIPWDCIRQSALGIATYQVRNRATMVGNLCNASPAADCAPPLLVLEASVKIREEDGMERDLPLEKFFTGVKQSALKPGQWAVGVKIPFHPRTIRTAFMKKMRIRGHDLAIVNAAGCCNPDDKKLRIAVGACAPTPLLFNFDELYADASSVEPLVKEAAHRVLAHIRPISDNRGSAEYRTDMAGRFVQKIITAIYVEVHP